MANVYVTLIEPLGAEAIRGTLSALAERISGLAGRCREHRVVSDPADADVILLNASYTLHFSHVDRARLCIRRHPLRRRYPEKCFVYDPDDDPCLFVPGVFASLDERRWDKSMHRAGPYLHLLGNPLLEPRKPVGEALHLFSFRGAPSTHPVRREVMKIDSPRGQIIATDAKWPQGRAERDAFKEQYAHSIHDSKFVLCPRGRGTASARLFDALQAGRVPVIISDHWVPPVGPDWESCSVRVSENAIAEIPRVLAELEPDVAQMAQSAREVFDEWLSEDRVFGRVVESCLELKSQNHGGRRWGGVRAARYWFRLATFKRFVIAAMIGRLRGRQVK